MDVENMNKMFILGLDGLEYNLVEKWNLEHLKQKVYGKIKVPISKETNFPITPEVWASFLVGKELEGIVCDRLDSREKILDILRYLRKRIKLSLGIGRLFRPTKRFPELRIPTFIDRFDGISEINAPYYSYDHAVITTLLRFGKNRFTIKDTIAELFKLYKKRRKQILEETKKKIRDSSVIFAYLHFPDSIEHFLYLKPKKLKNFYYDIEYFVLQIKEITGDIPFIIVSDHGIDLKNGLHSLYGFFSANVTLNPKPESITDFYRIIGNFLSVTSAHRSPH